MTIAAGVYKLRFPNSNALFDAELTVGGANAYTNDEGANGSIDFVASFVNLFSDQIVIQAATIDIDRTSQSRIDGEWTLGGFQTEAVLTLIDRDNGGEVFVRGRAQDDVMRGFGRDANEFRGLGGDDTLVGRAGEDRLIGGAGSDNLNGGGGADTLIGGGQSDNLSGGGGTDNLRGGGGADMLNGGGGRDFLNGGGGDDELSGGGGADTLQGRGGDDTLTGGNGADAFFFRSSDGEDVVTDFGRGSDVVDLRRVSSISDFEDLLANHLDEIDGSAIIQHSGGSITFQGFSQSAFEEGDFVF